MTVTATAKRRRKQATAAMRKRKLTRSAVREIVVSKSKFGKRK